MTTPHARFRRFIAARRTLGFSWEEGRDCCLLCADARIAMGDPDFAEDVRGYSTKKGAVKKLLEAGFLTVGHLLRARLRRVNRARLGTIIMVSEPPLDMLFIAESARLCWGQGEHGLVAAPIPPNAQFWEP